MFPAAHGVVSQGGTVAPPPAGLAIALIVANAEHDTTTQTTGEISALGHTVTVVAEGDVGSTNFSGFDALVTCRVTASTGVGNAIRALMDAGLPAVLGAVPTSPPSNNNVDTIANRTGLAGSWWRVRSAQQVWLDITDNTHPITSPFSTGQLAVLQAAGYRTGGSVSGTVLGISSVFTGGSEPGLVVWDEGDEDHAGTPLVARAVIVDFIGSGQALTAGGSTILDRSLRWAVGEL